MPGHSQGGSGADVQLLALQGVPAMAVVFTRGGDFDARTQGQSRGPRALQIAPGLLGLVSRENLRVTVGGGVLQREHRLGRLMGAQAGIICREKGRAAITYTRPRRRMRTINVSYEYSRSHLGSSTVESPALIAVTVHIYHVEYHFLFKSSY